MIVQAQPAEVFHPEEEQDLQSRNEELKNIGHPKMLENRWI